MNTTTKTTTTDFQAIFIAWLQAERFHFMMLPTPEKMLRSPSSLSGQQRAWLHAHIEAKALASV